MENRQAHRHTNYINPIYQKPNAENLTVGPGRVRKPLGRGAGGALFSVSGRRDGRRRRDLVHYGVDAV